jgi:hypothetical protein
MRTPPTVAAVVSGVVKGAGVVGVGRGVGIAGVAGVAGVAGEGRGAGAARSALTCSAMAVKDSAPPFFARRFLVNRDSALISASVNSTLTSFTVIPYNGRAKSICFSKVCCFFCCWMLHTLPVTMVAFPCKLGQVAIVRLLVVVILKVLKLRLIVMMRAGAVDVGVQASLAGAGVHVMTLGSSPCNRGLACPVCLTQGLHVVAQELHVADGNVHEIPNASLPDIGQQIIHGVGLLMW